MENKDKRYFQWITGEQKGQILIFDKIESDSDGVFVVFKDGSRMNEELIAPINLTDLTGKFMAEIENSNNCWKFEEKWVGREEEKWEKNANGETVCVQPFSPGRKTWNLIPPRHTPKKSSSFGLINKIEEVSQPIQDKQKSNVDENDPVYILMSKSKKSDIDINMNITISLPPKNLFILASESFDNGDEKFINYIVNEIGTDIIKESLKEAIKEMYTTVTPVTNI
ncbi:hypothetical protein M0Q50_09775 [bacterium]|jgi:hypothetical protein|nr:hypothetical protein [bacterium]